MTRESARQGFLSAIDSRSAGGGPPTPLGPFLRGAIVVTQSRGNCRPPQLTTVAAIAFSGQERNAKRATWVWCRNKYKEIVFDCRTRGV